MKPTAYISDEGVLFKELPPNPLFNLTPLYTKEQIAKNKEVYLSDFLKNERLKLDAREE
jgi:hypothetical protein